MTRSVKYKGDLSTPIAPMRRPSMFDDVDQLQADDREFVHHEYAKKINLLFDHYGINRKSKYALDILLWSLIIDHVPGFARGEKNTKPTIWTLGRQADLVTSVEVLVSAGLTEAEALRRIEKEGRFPKQKNGLRRRYDQAVQDTGTLLKPFLRDASKAEDPTAFWSALRDVLKGAR